MKKLWKVLVIAALVLLTAAMLWGCEKKQPEASVQDDNVIIAWNVNAADYRGKPGEVPGRYKDDDGYYPITFAYGGEQVRLRVTEETYKKGLDMQEVVCLQLNEEKTTTSRPSGLLTNA